MFPFRALTRRSPLVSFAAPALAFASLIAVSTIALTGCGTGGDDNKTFNGGGGVITPSPSPSGTTFAGRTYTARTITLQNGQTASVTFTTKADGTATGTATINDPTRKASRLVISTPLLSGTFNPQTGAINLSGSYTVNGQTFNLAITGNLPVPPATTGGSITLTVNGQSYTTAFGGGVSPSPSPSPNASPSPSASPATVVYETFTGTITNTGNATRITSGPFTIKGVVYLPQLQQGYLVASEEDPFQTAVGSIRRGFQIVRPTTSVGVASPLPGAGGSMTFYQETISVENTAGPRASYDVSSGTVTVVTATGTELVVRFDNVKFVHNNSSSGSFTLNGTFATKTANIR